MGRSVKAAAARGALPIDGGTRPRIRARDARSWTSAKEKRFLEVLAESCNVKLAAERAGLSHSNVYTRRQRDAGFRRGWDQALAIGYAQLEMMMLERALHGVEKVVVARDGTRDTMREYSDRVGLALLRMHRDTAIEAGHEDNPDEVAEAAERILSRLRRMSKAAAKDGDEIETKSVLGRIALLRWALRFGRE